MLTVTSNIGEVIGYNIEVLKTLEHPDIMLRTIASTLTGVIRKRVNEDGKDSSGNQIGTYSPEYMKVRTGNFGNSGKYSRGKNKGQVKDSGVFSRGDKKGVTRPKYNRTADTKVVASLTRQLENDLGTNEADPVKTEQGYAIGFKNPLNFNKSQWVEATYKKEIWKLTKEEEEVVQKIADKFTDNAFTGKSS